MAALTAFPISRLDALGFVTALSWMGLSWRSRASEAVPVALVLGTLALTWCAALWAWRIAQEMDRTRLLPRLWLWAVVFRTAGLLANPVLEDDHYRFLWDGYRFAQSGNPYGKAPAEFFGDESVPPEFQRILDQVNNPHIPTIYGPVSEWAFRLSNWIAPARILPWKLMVTLADLAAIGLILPVAGAPNTLFYAWCPLLIQETSFNAHPESLGVVALMAAVCWRLRGHGGRAAAALGLAAGVKITGGLLAPVLLWRAGWKSWLVLAGTVAVLWGPFWIQGSSGEWTAYLEMARNWEFNSSLFGLAGWIAGERWAHFLCAAAIAGIYLCSLGSQARAPSAREWPRGERLYGAFFAFSPVVNPWYLLWMLPFAAIRPAAWTMAALALVSMSYLCGLHLGSASLGPYEHPAWLRPVEYGGIALAGLAGWRRRPG